MRQERLDKILPHVEARAHPHPVFTAQRLGGQVVVGGQVGGWGDKSSFFVWFFFSDSVKIKPGKMCPSGQKRFLRRGAGSVSVFPFK